MGHREAAEMRSAARRRRGRRSRICIALLGHPGGHLGGPSGLLEDRDHRNYCRAPVLTSPSPVRLPVNYDYRLASIFCVATCLTAASPQSHEPENLALRATVSATSEYSGEYRAEFAIDGVIPAARRSDGAAGHEWATKGTQQADFVLTWPRPVDVTEVIYYGRTSAAVECFKDYAVHLGHAVRPVVTGSLLPGHGPQRIRLPKTARVRRLTVRFSNSHGAHNPGAAELQVYSRSPAKETIGVFQPLPPMGYLPPAPKADPIRLEAAAETLAVHGVREIVYAERPRPQLLEGLVTAPVGEGHWYANFGYYAWDFNTKAYPRRRQPVQVRPARRA